MLLTRTLFPYLPKPDPECPDSSMGNGEAQGDQGGERGQARPGEAVVVDGQDVGGNGRRGVGSKVEVEGGRDGAAAAHPLIHAAEVVARAARVSRALGEEVGRGRGMTAAPAMVALLATAEAGVVMLCFDMCCTLSSPHPHSHAWPLYCDSQTVARTRMWCTCVRVRACGCHVDMIHVLCK